MSKLRSITELRAFDGTKLTVSFQLSCAGGLSWGRTLVGDLIETDHNVAGQVGQRETGARGQRTGRTRTGKDRQI